MAKAPTLTDLTGATGTQSTINNNNAAIEAAFENTLSLDGSTPNAMEADLDLNGNQLLNIGTLSADSLVLAGSTVTGLATVPDWKGAWATSTSYVLNDIVSQNGSSYICVEAHTSGTFSTDLASMKWELFAQQGSAGAGTGDMLAANNLSDVSDVATARANLQVPHLSGASSISATWTFSTNQDFTDNSRLRFGSGNDMQIYHTGSESVISDVGTGDLQIRATNLGLYTEDGLERYLLATANAGVELYYDGSKIAETVSNGFQLSSDLVMSESATPSFTSSAGLGQFWVKNDSPCTPYFTDDEGNDNEIATVSYVDSQVGGPVSSPNVGRTAVSAWASNSGTISLNVGASGHTGIIADVFGQWDLVTGTDSIIVQLSSNGSTYGSSVQIHGGSHNDETKCKIHIDLETGNYTFAGGRTRTSFTLPGASSGTLTIGGGGSTATHVRFTNGARTRCSVFAEYTGG